jgi:hypothetical protein
MIQHEPFQGDLNQLVPDWDNDELLAKREYQFKERILWRVFDRFELDLSFFDADDWDELTGAIIAEMAYADDWSFMGEARATYTVFEREYLSDPEMRMRLGADDIVTN